MADFERDKQIRLPDGRVLCYAEYGDASGKPVFYFHGFPSSRLESQFTDGVAGRLGVRIIAPDRPGYGYSDYKPDRIIGEWPDDVLALADELALDRFAILGVSGGGPYAAACAHSIPHRMTSAGIVCGLGPLDVPGTTQGKMRAGRLVYFLARTMPGLADLLCGTVAAVLSRNPERLFSLMKVMVSRPDSILFRQPQVKRILLESYREAFRQGPQGIERELRLYVRPWGFRLEDITMPVHLWHGEQDNTVPVRMGRHYAKTIPACRAEFYPAEGHFSMPIYHMEHILGRLVA